MIADELQKGLAYLQAGNLAGAEAAYKTVLHSHPNYPEALLMLGVVEHRRGRLDSAFFLIDSALAVAPNYAEALYYRGIVLGALNRQLEALGYFDQALAIRPDFADALNDRGNALIALNRQLEALTCYDRALAIKPKYTEALYNRGYVLSALGHQQDALASYDQALSVNPDFAEALHNRANSLIALNRTQEALTNYDRALAIKPDYAEALYNRGNALFTLKRPQEALASYDRALAVKPNYAEVLNSRGDVLRSIEAWQQALESYERALAILPNYADALTGRGRVLRAMNRWQESLQSYTQALAVKPDHAEARFGQCMAELPVLYTDEPEIAVRRAAYKQRLGKLCEDVDRGAVLGDLAAAVGTSQPFLLAYQGRNDRELQAQYGALVCQIMAERYSPATLALPPGPNDPVRLGIVSGHFCGHSVWKIPIKGWLSQLDRRRFRVIGYFTGNRSDAATNEAIGMCDRFVQGPRSLESWRQMILSDAPHVLLYPEIGMDPQSAALAALRLAAVQCISLGHPDTTGMPTVDYFLSSDLMEPSDGQDHYTEKLIRLPNLSIYYEPVVTETVSLTRTDVGLRPTSTVFWCGQSLYKYLPQFDQVFARIAKESGDCQFVFIQYPRGTQVTALFKRRLEQAFAAVELLADNYCTWLPQLNQHQFVAAIGLCDIVLDSIGWSGHNSTLEGLAHDLPIVTMPGPLMRGRHTTAILKMMGVTDTIAETIDNYVSTAVRLARDAPWRSAVKEKIAASKHRVYRDKACITALEEFLDRVARQSGG